MLLFPSYLLKFRYADLKNNRLTDYTFSCKKMLSDKVPSCTLISFDLIKNHSLSIWMMITHMIRYAGKYRCLPSVCACSYLFHHPESQQGYWRVENGEPSISTSNQQRPVLGAEHQAIADSCCSLCFRFQKASITFVHADERALGLHVIRFQEVRVGRLLIQVRFISSWTRMSCD